MRQVCGACRREGAAAAATVGTSGQHRQPRAEASRQDSRMRFDPDFRPMRTSIRTYHNIPSQWQRAQERKRRSTLLALGTSCGTLPPPPVTAADRQGRSLGPRGSVQSWDASPTQALLRDQLRDQLIATPTAARRDLRPTIAQHNRERPPSRCQTAASWQRNSRSAAGARTPQAAQQRPATSPVTQVDPAPLATCTLPDPCACAPPLVVSCNLAACDAANRLCHVLLTHSSRRCATATCGAFRGMLVAARTALSPRTRSG